MLQESIAATMRRRSTYLIQHVYELYNVTVGYRKTYPWAVDSRRCKDKHTQRCLPNCTIVWSSAYSLPKNLAWGRPLGISIWNGAVRGTREVIGLTGDWWASVDVNPPEYCTVIDSRHRATINWYTRRERDTLVTTSAAKVESSSLLKTSCMRPNNLTSLIGSICVESVWKWWRFYFCQPHAVRNHWTRRLGQLQATTVIGLPWTQV